MNNNTVSLTPGLTWLFLSYRADLNGLTTSLARSIRFRTALPNNMLKRA